MKDWKCYFLCATLSFALSATARAAAVYTDKATFLADTGATLTAPIPLQPTAVTSLVVGDLTLSTPSPSFITGDYSNRIDANVVTISSLEHLNVDLATRAFGFGFDFHEPEFDPNLFDTFVDSTFEVTLLLDGAPVDDFSFNAPNDAAAFAGVWSGTPFNRVVIRETVGASENEFYGQFYAQYAPEPGTMLSLVLGTLLSVGSLSRFRRREKNPPFRFSN